MEHVATRWLFVSAGLEMMVSILLGYVMLIPMQPWAKGLRERWPGRAIMSVHLDLVMLSLLQVAAATGMYVLPRPHDTQIAPLLIISGWSNVLPYAWRLVGVNAFALAGDVVQKSAALVSLAGTLMLTAGWGLLVVGWL